MSFPTSVRHKNCNNTFNFANYASNRKTKAEEFRNESYQSLQKDDGSKDLREIKKKFEDMCSYGEVANSKTLKSFKIKKLYERTKLMKLVDSAWLDIHIVNLLRTSESGKVEFFQFMELLSITAKKLHVSFD